LVGGGYTGGAGVWSRNNLRSKELDVKTWNSSRAMVDKVMLVNHQDHFTIQWKGLNGYSRGWVLKIASFEGSGYLGQIKL